MKSQLNTYQDDNKLVAGALKKFGINKNNNNYDDLFSEGLLTLVESKNSYNETKSKFTTYFFNQIFYMVSKYNKQELKNTPIVDNYDFNLKASDFNLEDTILERLTPVNLNNLNKAISSLKEKEQDIIKKRFWEGLSFSEIGVIYNKSKQAVQQMFQRVIEKLKHFFAGVDDFEMCI
jgi:RNA polymerase sigma factor (sigma-70 family)